MCIPENDSATCPEPLESIETLIARAIPNYEARPQQLAMAEAVESAFTTRQHLIVEAGTGVGKSFAYLLPAIRRILSRRERIVISTHTIALQEQLIEKDIPALKSVFDQDFKAVLVKGRQNYISIRRLMQTSRRQKAVFSSPAELRQLHQIEDWTYTTHEGSLSDMDFQPSLRVWQRVRSESQNCMGHRCEYYDKCFFQRARREMEKADLLVVNHALFFSDLALRQHNVTFLPEYDFVVFDEAHTIESVASDHFGLSLSNAQVNHLLNGLFNERTGRGFLGMLECQDAIKCVVDAGSRADTLFTELAERYHPERGTARIPNRKSDNDNGPADTDGIPNLLSPALRELAGQLKKLKGQFEREDDQFELRSFADRCTEMAGTLDAFLGQQCEDHVYWIESSGRNGDDDTEESPKKPRKGGRGRSLPSRTLSLHAAPLRVNQLLQQNLFERTKAIVLTSATLSTGGEDGFAYVRDRLGAVESIELLLGSPFDYENQVTLHVEVNLPEPNAPGFIGAACDRIRDYLSHTQGRAFVLFTSYAALDEATEQLESWCEASGMTLFAQGRGLPRSQMLERFKKTDNAVIFGTDSFWQGVDVPGEALSNVIITKLPFAAPTRPLIQARIDAIRASGGEPFMQFQLPEAILKLKQGFGRLIRSHTDQGIVVILDKRVRTKGYGARFLDALPRCRVEIHR